MNQTFFSTLYLKVEGKLSKQKKSVTVNIFFLVCNTIHCGFTVWHDTDFPRQLFKVLVSFYGCSFKY